jgi:hypothetical protein
LLVEWLVACARADAVPVRAAATVFHAIPVASPGICPAGAMAGS